MFSGGKIVGKRRRDEKCSDILGTWESSLRGYLELFDVTGENRAGAMVSVINGNLGTGGGT